MEQTSFYLPLFFDLNISTRTQSVSKVQRALLLPQEVIQLPRDEQIILIDFFLQSSQRKLNISKISSLQVGFYRLHLYQLKSLMTQKRIIMSKKSKLSQ